MALTFKSIEYLAVSAALAIGASHAARPAQAEMDIRIDARPLGAPIQLHALVEEADAPVAGLSAGDFAVTLDGQPLTELTLTRPRSLGADVKTSVAIVTGWGVRPEVAAGSYENLIRQLRAGDHAAIVKFRYRPNGEYSLLYMSTLPFMEMDGDANTAEAIKFLGRNPELYGRGSSPLPAMHAIGEFDAAESMLPAGPRALIGGFAPGNSQLEMLIDRAIAGDIALFNVAYAGEWLESFLAKRAATRDTGGALVVVNDASQDDLAVSRIADWLNDSYRLSIPADAVTDCDLHALELSVRDQSAVLSFSRCDSNPDPFTFEWADEVEPGVTVVSPVITITGIDGPVPVDVFGGEYSIGCGSSFTSEPGFIQPLDSVCVRHVSSQLPNDSTATVISVGSSWATFESLTRYFQRPPPPSPATSGGGGSMGILDALLLLGLSFALRACGISLRTQFPGL